MKTWVYINYAFEFPKKAVAAIDMDDETALRNQEVMAGDPRTFVPIVWTDDLVICQQYDRLHVLARKP